MKYIPWFPNKYSGTICTDSFVVYYNHCTAPNAYRGSVNVNGTQLSCIFPKTIAQIWVNLDMYLDLFVSMGDFWNSCYGSRISPMGDLAKIVEEKAIW